MIGENDTYFTAIGRSIREEEDNIVFDSLLSHTDSRFSMSDDNGKVIVEFKSNGVIEIGEGYTPTEAADLFLETLLKLYPYLFD